MPARNEDEESHTDSKEPPKSSSTIYMAEGNKLFRMSRFREAIESYSMVSNQFAIPKNYSFFPSQRLGPALSEINAQQDLAQMLWPRGDCSKYLLPGAGT